MSVYKIGRAEGTTLTLINGAPWSGSNTGLRINRFLVAMVGIALVVFVQRGIAQAPPPSDGSAKAAEESKAKTQSTSVAKPVVAENSPAIDPDSYHIGLADQLMISVWKEPELSMTVVVRPDGMITLPLINDIHVVGLKPVELQQILIDKLKPFLTEPQVTVIVQGIRSRKVYLVGNVSKQGAVPLDGGETVLQVLAAAGGVGPFAKADSIYILRTENNKQVRIPFQYKKALKGKVKEDIVLQPGDMIVVP
jgi:polysaccharide export outer membrane protein